MKSECGVFDGKGGDCNGAWRVTLKAMQRHLRYSRAGHTGLVGKVVFSTPRVMSAIVLGKFR